MRLVYGLLLLATLATGVYAGGNYREKAYADSITHYQVMQCTKSAPLSTNSSTTN